MSYKDEAIRQALSYVSMCTKPLQDMFCNKLYYRGETQNLSSKSNDNFPFLKIGTSRGGSHCVQSEGEGGEENFKGAKCFYHTL